MGTRILAPRPVLGPCKLILAMPTTTTTVTSTGPAGTTTTTTTATEPEGLRLDFDGICQSWPTSAPATSVAPFISFDKILELPEMADAFDSVEVTGNAAGDTRTVKMGELSLTETCVAAYETGHSYMLCGDNPFHITNYRASFTVCAVSRALYEI